MREPRRPRPEGWIGKARAPGIETICGIRLETMSCEARRPLFQSARRTTTKARWVSPRKPTMEKIRVASPLSSRGWRRVSTSRTSRSVYSTVEPWGAVTATKNTPRSSRGDSSWATCPFSQAAEAAMASASATTTSGKPITLRRTPR